MSIVAPAAANGVHPPLRVLCIHGFCQSASTFKGRTAALRSTRPHHTSFIAAAQSDYAEAPHELQPGESVFADESSTPGAKFTWWRTNPPVPTGHYTGLLDSITHIRTLCTTAPQPYSGLLGFSQGASFTSLLLQLRQLWQAAQRDGAAMLDMGPAEWRDSAAMREVCSLDYAFLSSVRFALLFSAFVPRDPALRQLFTSHRFPIGGGGLRSLHVMGEQDRVIAIDSSRELAQCFEQAGGEDGGGVEVVVHGTGHHVPSDAAMRRRYVEFIQRQAEAMGRLEGAADQDGEAEVDRERKDAVVANGKGG